MGEGAPSTSDLPMLDSHEYRERSDDELQPFLDRGLALKDEGNNSFRIQEFDTAANTYSTALALLRPLLPPLPPKTRPVPKITPTDPSATPSSSAPGVEAATADGSATGTIAAADGAEGPPTNAVDEAPPPPPPLTDVQKRISETLAICFANRGACHMKHQRYEEALEDCKDALLYNGTYVKALLRRAEACEALSHRAIAKEDSLEASGKLQTAVDDLRRALELEPNCAAARVGLKRMEPELQRQQEKMKDEMLGKLKTFGNFLLGKVGLSLDNFETTKDPETGSMSINFKQNQ
eukprot:NODE_1252_length_1021_cov_287.662551_g870_i0.p1 GENE.NODE_1252_length_1021_cov_287.662551_g870_i0~~NODE_1252_length_1021_cov_287.662551_g870_i0.p1  ORF type:complete len:302 (+),score=92.56 NODE_1252_length_1021_cov_287.662551_g870_i0:27-908(+)